MAALRELIPESKVLYQVTDTHLDKIISEMKKSFHDEVQKLKVETREEPMTKSKTAKYLSCSPSNVDKKWKHLGHKVNGTWFWLESELKDYIKKS
jgi:hypothetical protein